MTRLVGAILLGLGLVGGAGAADTPAHTYLRFKPVKASGVYAEVGMRLHRSPWSLALPDLPRAARNYTRFRLAAGQYSDWAELPGDWGTIVLSFHQDAPLASPEVEIQLAIAADDKTVFRTIELKENSAIVSLCLPPDYRLKPDGIVTVRANAAAHLEFARAAAGPGQPPRSRFPFYTGGAGGLGTLYTDPEILHTELRALRTLGINGLGFPGDPDYLQAVEQVGFDNFLTSGAENHEATAAAQRKLSAAAFAKIQVLALHDEPGNTGLGMLDGLPPAKFHAYLEAQGLKPSDFGQDTWEPVTPVKTAAEARQIVEEWGAKRGKSASMRYYWTMRFTQQLTTDWLRAGTASAEKTYGTNVHVFVNFTDHPLIIGAGMYPGPDWFLTGLTRATTMGWSEDWLSQAINSWGNGLLQRVGFLVDILRAAGSRHHLPIGFYNTFDNEEGLRLKTLCGIGHGVKSVYFWDYGPTYTATENYWSDAPSTYNGVAQVVREVASADDLILAGQPPPAAVAIVYATTGEIWEPSWELSTERQLLYLALEQEQYVVDLLNEDLLLERDLARYRVIYVADKQLPRVCQEKLAAWTRAGGTLALLPEAASRDEYDRPTRLIARPLLPPGSVVEAGPSGASAFGQGRLAQYGFRAGNHFYGRIAAANPTGPVKVFPAPARALIAWPCELAAVPRRVTVSQPGVGAYLLESERGAVLILCNYTRDPIDKLEVRVRLDGIRRVTAHRQGKLKPKIEGGLVTFTLPLDLTDVVALRR